MIDENYLTETQEGLLRGIARVKQYTEPTAIIFETATTAIQFSKAAAVHSPYFTPRNSNINIDSVILVDAVEHGGQDGLTKLITGFVAHMQKGQKRMDAMVSGAEGFTFVEEYNIQTHEIDMQNGIK